MSKTDELERLKTMLEGANIDKATLVWLIIKEFRKEYGDKALMIARRAAYQRGAALGKRVRKCMEEKGRDINDLLEVRRSYVEVAGTTAKRRDLITEKNKLEYDILYCPSIEGLKKGGFSDEETSLYCEVMSETDKALPKEINPKIEVKPDGGLGKGKDTCHIIWEIK
jgi:hypothetical protein